jgi:cobalt/nickel transport system permease protein
MHIPDGFLSTPVWAAFDAVSFPAVGLVARRTQRGMEDTRIPLLGVLGAFVFAAQMINFPLGAGTSGHLVGGTLLAIVLGPAPAAIVMTAILAIQAFVFQDGGIVSLGANIFNMALAGVLAGSVSHLGTRHPSFRGDFRRRRPQCSDQRVSGALGIAGLRSAHAARSSMGVAGAVPAQCVH